MTQNLLRRNLSRWALCAVATAAVLIVAVTPGHTQPQPADPGDTIAIRNSGSPDAVPGQYIVVFKSRGRSAAAVTSAAADIARTHGGRVKHTYDSVLNGYSAEMTQEQAKAVARNTDVAYVQQARYMYTLDTQNNPPNWGDDRVDQRDLPLNQAFTYPANPGQGARVYVMDTGINANHVDFTGRIAQGRDLVDNDNDPSDCQGHGTHVAGTAAGTSYGIAKKATIVAVRVLDCAGSGTDADILAGVNWVKANAVKPAVVNYSIGCRSRCADTTMDNAVKDLIASGVQWVQAAGNSNDDACFYSPQLVPEAVTVGNTNNTDARNSSSSWGTCLDIFAPGTSIVSASYTNNTGTATMSGTSMASPHTAGAAAVYLGQNPNATPQQVRDALVTNSTANKVTSPGTGSPNRLLYTGFMNGTPSGVTVTNPGSQTSTVGTAVALNNSATGGTSPYTWSATGLPAGLSISSSSGQITGTPTTAGSSNVSVTAADSSNPVKTGSASFTWTVNATGTCGPVTNGTDVSIADNATAESPATVSGCTGNASATSSVAVAIVHTYIGDLIVSLIAPDGSVYTLHNRTGGSADNINTTYTVNLSSEARNGTWKLRVQDAAAGDVGYINSWTLDTAGAAPGCTGTNGSDVSIPDNTTVNSTLAISGCTGNASAASSVAVAIVHTYIGDLIVSLIAPDGSVYTLHNRTGGSADNINTTYTVNLSSEARNGTWTLRVQDAAASDTGYINSWTLTL